MSDDRKLSSTEKIKVDSQYLRGQIAEDLLSSEDQFSNNSVQLLKFHGTYQQDDRDQRNKQAGGKSTKSYSMMVRTRVPGGRLTAEQLIAHLDLCDSLGNATLKCTSRQALQLHSILKKDLRAVIHRINQVQLSTLAACGDVNRNVMCCPSPVHSPAHEEIHRLTQALKEHLAPRTKAYYELWVRDDETGESSLEGGEVEPIYGPTYLPRKFKIGVTLPDDNCVDIYTQDLGFIAVVRGSQTIGYNVVVGGGMGMTPSAAKTFPALATRMAFVTPDQAVGVAEAVVKVQRDYGDRTDRKRARLKYLIADRGIDWFREQVQLYFGSKLADCTPDDVTGVDLHMGWHAQGDGKFFYGLHVDSGRLYDSQDRRWKTAMRQICREHQPNIRLTGNQNVLLTDLNETALPSILSILKENNVPRSEVVSTVRKWSMSCVALPTCGLAVTESERVLPDLLELLEQELARLGLEREAFTVRITGCPNGCARPFNADIGLVGKSVGKYTIYLGGQLLGTRLGAIYKDLVPLDEIVPALVPVLAEFKACRRPGESLGDFCARVGVHELAKFEHQAH